MESAALAFGIMGFMLGAVSFMRIEKLIKELKDKKILDESYKNQ